MKNSTLLGLIVSAGLLLASVGCGAAAASRQHNTALPVAMGNGTPDPASTAAITATPQPTHTPAPTATPTPSGITIAIDPGHGGSDLGARHFDKNGQMDVHESTVTLAISLKLGQKLEALGYKVFYTHSDDTQPDDGFDQDINGDGKVDLRDIMQARIDLINQSHADLMLSIHMNAWESDDEELLRETGGTETYYCPDRPFGKQNLRLAQLVHQNVLATLAKLGDKVSDRGVIIDDAPAYPGDTGGHLMILGPANDIITRSTNMPGILSEPVFITCDREAALVQQPAAQDALAQAYADAVVQYFKEFPKQ